jgi:hypothetical protein
MVSMLFKLVFVCAHLQFSASAHASSSGVDDCKSGVCTAQIEVDDATAMIQGKAKISLDGQISKEDVMLLTKSAGVEHLLEVKGIERLTAAQKMESSMETAVTKMIDGRGRALPEEVLKSIDTAMEDLRQELVGEKNILQTQMNDANSAVAKCNTNMQATSGGGVATAKGSAVDTNETHRTCRDAEVSAYDAKTAACDLLVSKTKIVSGAAPKCNCEMSGSDTTSAVLSCLANNRKWTEWHENNLTMQQSDCDTKTKTWSNKADACDTNQSSYEVAVCIYAGKLESMCTTLDTCYIDANASRTSMVASVKIEEQHLKAVLASAKKITCFMSILKNSTARNLTMSDLDVCKKLDVFLDKTYLSTAVNDLNISILPVDAKENCQTLTSTPGDDQWAAKEYAKYTKEWLRESAVCPHKTTTTTTTKATTTTTTTQAEVQFQLGAIGSDKCPQGFEPILDEATCKEASESMSKPFMSSFNRNIGQTSSWGSWCYFAAGHSGGGCNGQCTMLTDKKWTQKYYLLCKVGGTKAYVVGANDASCSDNTIGVTTQPDVSSCQSECNSQATCKFVAYCPAGTSGCEGGDSGSCVTYATCSTNSNQGYTMYQKATTTTTTTQATRSEPQLQCCKDCPERSGKRGLDVMEMNFCGAGKSYCNLENCACSEIVQRNAGSRCACDHTC